MADADLQSASLIPRGTEIAHKVRTVLSQLLQIGRPAPAADLVARCSGLGLSPELVEFICSVPGSPMRFTKDGFVTYAFAGFESGLRQRFGSILTRLEDEGTGGLSWRIGCGFERRKRKGDDLAGLEFMPAKRRARLLYCNDDETDSKALVSSKRSRIGIPEVTPLPAVYRRRSPRNHGKGSIGLLFPGSSGKLLSNSGTVVADSNLGVSGHPCFNDSKTIAYAETMHPAVLESDNIETLHLLPLPMTDGKMMGNKSCTLFTHGDIKLKPLSIADETEVGDPQSGNLDGSYADMAYPRDSYKISPSAGGCQLVPSEVQDFQIDTDQIVQQGQNTISGFSGTAKKSSQICSMLRKGSKVVNSQFSPLERKKETRREIRDIQPAADDHGLSKTRRVFCEKMKTSHHKSKPPFEHPNLLMASRKSVSKNLNTLKETAKKDISVPMTQDCVEETAKRDADAVMDQTKINADPKIRSEKKTYPTFDSFNVVEEEGSGGYGTVFKARRKSDNEIFAIKCPHPNAPRHHVYNELSMLQRFGGKNFIIRLEDSFKYEDSRCFVLEHVVHDRPEVLKKEIDVSQLRWYAYCMFEALANLHKHGVVHRDIKPGNFLFSREVNIGYLIDFNLAVDLHHKNRPSKRPKTDSNSAGSQTLVNVAAHNPIEIRKLVGAKNKDGVDREKERASIADSRNLKAAASRTKTSTSLCKGKQSLNKSHVALDDSGVTSIKDMTSIKNRPVDRMRQPMPSNGRKEILKLAKEAMQAPKHKALHIPVSKSKRILAPPEKIDRKLVCFSPMPLQSSGAPVVSTGFLSHRGDEKKQKEGPCAGTKGFRAPEVLFRSTFQGPKMDVWSAGVTLLYLMIGKTPFYGDINENIKGIAKLRGSEDLWEVAKLHNQESAFPMELFDVKYLPSIKLREWCQLNSKRPSFVEEAPDVLYDFLDKCLTVNPRLRISAEDALQHEFLTPCRDMLLQQILLSSPTI